MANKESVADHLLTNPCGGGPRVPETGMVYFWGDPSRKIKIGTTSRPAGRHRELRSTTGLPGKMLATVHGGTDLEQAYHRRFAEWRQRGEWFSPAPAILAEIERLCAN
ncbi:MAG: GIY-YIG nuclease family protein [Alphaproteobacteria bacterium]|nr:GIY-YIG nuclease family protein [Alphaproteobacteria bacterium]